VSTAGGNLNAGSSSMGGSTPATVGLGAVEPERGVQLTHARRDFTSHASMPSSRATKSTLGSVTCVGGSEALPLSALSGLAKAEVAATACCAVVRAVEAIGPVARSAASALEPTHVGKIAIPN
jgi:hypothetical protein